ncbi:uncharacterized protein NMB1333-like [Mercenaria mercenaria]|uniref:uncharacterized protein NMB1333-like n=1 Tax=Mercenaria mercenaria TaxID=6596 RepID=UPI00234E8243|nr:uncharacterized protein NMB1333-like [Mercenaria mercenaria]XP_045204423.2 uncharacterized protein NMB1333-like [Mercenaria mercenaria]XP_053399477.1 uncharacterized protein NMB1333-like [Mercenaria mercenaria]
MDFEAVNWDVGSEAKELDRSLFQKNKKKQKNSKKRKQEEDKVKLNDSAENKKRKMDKEGKEKLDGSLKAIGVSDEASSELMSRKEKRNKKWQEKILRRKLMDESNDTEGLTKSAAVSEPPCGITDKSPNKSIQAGKDIEEKSPMKRSEKRKLRWEKIQEKRRLKLEQSKPDTNKVSNKLSKPQAEPVGATKDVSDKNKGVHNENNVNMEDQLNRKERKKLLWKQKLKERKLSQKNNVENVNEIAAISVTDKKHEKEGNQKSENVVEDGNENKQKIKPKKGKHGKRKDSRSNETKSDESNSLENVDKQLHSPTKKREVEVNSSEENSGTEISSVKKKTKRKRMCKRNKFKGYVKPEPGTIKPQLEATKDLLEKSMASPGKTDSGTVKVNKNTDASFSEAASAVKDKSFESRKGKKKRKLQESESNETGTAEVVKTNSVKQVSNKKGEKKDGREPAGKQNKKKVALDPSVIRTILSPGSGRKTSDDSIVAEDDVAEAEDFSRAKKGEAKAKTLLEKSRERLNAARFRYLNEQLYITTGQEAFTMFKNDDVAFSVYHEGFQSQVEKWPTNPIDVIIEKLQAKPKHLILADFGCGDAKLARSVPNKVHSFDLVALNDHVTVCDMSKVPVKDGTVDIAVFCLSLMGTNLTSYLQEANRVLKNNGTLMIAEVTSRFHSIGGFVLKVEKMGFKIKQQDTDNKMFVMMEFKKTADFKDRNVEDIELKPCVYKKR